MCRNICVSRKIRKCKPQQKQDYKHYCSDYKPQVGSDPSFAIVHNGDDLIINTDYITFLTLLWFDFFAFLASYFNDME